MEQRQYVYPVKIRWSADCDNPYDALLSKNNCIYMILRKRMYCVKKQYRILYIGMAYYQSCAQRLMQDNHKLWDILHDYFDAPTYRGDIVVRFGEVILPDGRRLSEQLIRDIEALLIVSNQTEYNEVIPNCYRMLKITNTGTYYPLERTIDLSQWCEV